MTDKKFDQKCRSIKVILNKQNKKIFEKIFNDSVKNVNLIQ